MYLFSGNYWASVPISKIHVSASDVYSQDRSTYFLQQNIQADQSWEYINRSLTHECGNWDCGHAIPFLRIFVSNFRYWFFAMCSVHHSSEKMRNSVSFRKFSCPILQFSKFVLSTIVKCVESLKFHMRSYALEKQPIIVFD